VTPSTEHEEWGVWWLPGTHERAAGRLTFDPLEGAHLTVFGLLPGLMAPAWKWPALFGEAHGGTPMTLLSPVGLSQSVAGGESSATVRTELRAQVLLSGVHASSHDEFVIKKASVRLRGLRNVCFAQVQRGGQLTSFIDGHGNGPKEQLVTLPGGKLNFSYAKLETRSGFLVSTEDEVAVVVEIDEGLSLHEFEQRWLLPLQGLVTFVGRDPTLVEHLTAVVPRPTQVHPLIRHGNPQIHWDEDQVDVLMRLPGLTEKPRYHHGRPLVPLAVLEDDASAFIARWWVLYERLGPAVLFLMSAFGSRMFLENRLLNELSFAESYHRILHDDPPVSRKDHKQYVAAMLATINDPDDRDHYRMRLSHADEQAQRQRVDWLVKRASEILPGIAGLDTTLAGHLVKTRNALTHLDPAAAGSALRDEPLYRAVELLEVVLRANLLVDLGIPNDQARALLEGSYQGQTPFVPAR
jgi:ApeA N-terminal domain 1